MAARSGTIPTHRKLVARTTRSDVQKQRLIDPNPYDKDGTKSPFSSYFYNPNAYQELESFQDALGAPSLSNFFKVSMDLASENAEPIRQFPGDSAGQSIPVREAKGLNQWLTSCGVLSMQDKSNYELLANEAILPGTSMAVTQEIGSRQGIKERFATQRNYTDIAISFYVSADYKILRLFQEWMNFINPIYHSQQGIPYRTGSPVGYPDNDDAFAYHRFRYPSEYKKNISITKFERNMGTGGKKGGRKNMSTNGETPGRDYTPDAIQYNFVNAFPTSIQDIPLNYQAAQLVQVTVEFTYDRYYITNTAAHQDKLESSQTDPWNRLSVGNNKNLGANDLFGTSAGVG